MKPEKQVFRNVAVPIEDYELLDALARNEQRSKARQLSVLIRKSYAETFENE